MDLSTLFVGDTDQQLIDVHAHFLTESYVNARARPAMFTLTAWQAGRNGRPTSICG